MPATAAVVSCGRMRARLDAVEAEVLASVVQADGDAKRASRLAKQRGSSRRDSQRRADRASAVAKNPALGERLAGGDLSAEGLDVLADAAAKSEGEALFDERLIDQVAKAGPDQGRKITKQWLHDRDDAKTAAEKFERQRKLRSARRYDTADGTAAITIEGDDATIDAMWNEIVADADKLYRSDGGRDVRASDQGRTNRQRLFDACAARLRGRTGPGASRPTVVVTVGLDKLIGRDPGGCADQIGTGPIADSLLANYLEDADLVGMVFGGDGQPLWLGRKRRHASTAQHLALVVRDKGCVLCGAPANKCEAHHVIPWSAPAQGRTDLDHLALVCPSCHHEIHDTKQTIEWHADAQIWLSRPARPEEVPSPVGYRPRRERISARASVSPGLISSPPMPKKPPSFAASATA